MDEQRSDRSVDDVSRTTQLRLTLSWPLVAVLVLLVLLIIMPNVSLWLSLDRMRTERTKEQLFWLLCHPGYTDQQRREAFAELLWNNNREWRSARLARLNLTGAQLAGASVTDARMEGCRLSGADLKDADLRRTQLDQAELADADLSRANLFEADLYKADLRNAILMHADLRGVDLGQSQAAHAKFVSADMTAAKLMLADLSHADFRLTTLVDADLSLANLSSANLLRADLSGAILTQTKLINTNWWRAKGLDAKLIAQFTTFYPPSEDSDDTLKQDFQKWLAERASTKVLGNEP